MLWKEKWKKTISIMLAFTFTCCLTLPSLAEKAYAADLGVITLTDSNNDKTLSKAEIKDTLNTVQAGETYSLKLPSGVGIETSAFSRLQGLVAVELPADLTAIPDNAFDSCKNLEGIAIPDSVTAIGENAFFGCSKLQSITFNKTSTLLSIGKCAFQESGVTKITIPDSVIAIGNSAFYGCDSLKEVTLASKQDVSTPQMTIGSSAFASNFALTAIDIPDKVISIGYRAFSNSKYLNKLTLASDLSVSSPKLTIANNAFEFSGLTSLDIPNRVTSVGENAFVFNQSLKTVNLGSSPSASQLATIGQYAFNSCTSLERITIPDGVSKINTRVFNACDALESVSFGPGCKIDAIDEFAFAYCGNLSTFTIPSTVTTIGEEAFYGADKMLTFNIPAGVTNIGDGAFASCDSLTSLTVAAGHPNFVVENGVLFDAGKTKLIQYPAGLSQQTYTIPSTVSTIGAYSFSASKLAGIMIPSAVKEIGESAFSYSATLETLEFEHESKLEKIGDRAFCDNKTLKAIDIPASVKTIGRSAFMNNTALSEVTFSDEALTSIEEYAFCNCTGMRGITIPKGISSIGDGFLYGCSALESLTVAADNTKYVAENGALYSKNKDSLMMYALAKDSKTFSVPASVTSVAESAFIGAKNLETVTVDASNTNYKSEDGVLYSIDGETIIYYPLANKNTAFTIKAAVTGFHDELFNNCTYLHNINVESGSKRFSSQDGVLLSRDGMTLIQYPSARTEETYIMPSDVESVNNYAFVNCKNLKTVVAQKSLRWFNSYGFQGSNVTLYLLPESEAIESAISNGVTYTTKPFLGMTSVSNMTSSSTTLNFSANQKGSTYYYLVLKATDAVQSTPGSLLDIQKAARGVRGNGIVSAMTNTAQVSGLSPTTEYVAYLIVSSQNAENSEILSVPFKTTAASGGGSTGGGSGSSGGGTATPPKTPSDSTSAEVKVTTQGTASNARVTGDSMNKAIDAAFEQAKRDNSHANVTLSVDAPKDVKKVTTGIPTESLKKLGESKTDASLIVTSPIGSITFDNSAIETIGSTAKGSDINITAAKVEKSSLTAEQQALVGDRPVLDLGIESNGKAISNFGGTATVSIPYTPAQGENTSNLVVWYLADDGSLSAMPCTYADGKLSFTTTHFSKYVLASVPFKDISSNVWFYKAAVYAHGKGLMNGTSTGKFDPSANTTRGMIVTMLYRNAAQPAVSAKANFADVNTSAYYANAVTWANGKGLVKGSSDGKFEPDNFVTREQLVSILYRNAGSPAVGNVDMSKFLDASKVSAYAAPALAWAIQNGVIKGSVNGSLNPDGKASRAEVATMMMNYFNVVK